MAALVGDIAIEADAGLAEQLGCHAEINLRGGEVYVAEVDRQLGEKLLHVRPLPIPGRQPMDRERVTNVVQSRLVPRPV